MKSSCLSRFSFQTFICLTLSMEINSLRHYRDWRLRSSASIDGGNNFLIRSNLLPVQAGKQVEQIRNQEERKTSCINLETMLDVNETLSPTVALPKETTVCYDDLGCITRYSFAAPLLWLINILPEKREEIDTHFTLYTRENRNPQPPIRISAGNTNQISATTFKATRPTKFLIHGWTATGYAENEQLLLQRLLIKGDVNVIAVHWGEGASSFYTQARVNARLVGLEIALLVNTLVMKFDVKATDVHLIGHSLGAHIAGYAGKKIPNLGRITGLDPAGPYFENLPSFARLDYTDAQFVDVLHTNAGVIGIYEPLGHVDFYPHGGINQPDCTHFSRSDSEDSGGTPANVSVTGNVTVSIASAICDHSRAFDLYSASLEDNCQIVGYQCPDYPSFNKGKCTSCGVDNTKCAPFGMEAKNYPSRSQVKVKLYFNTAAKPPYCLSQYLVLVKLDRPPNAKAAVTGLLRLSVTGKDAVQTSSLPISVFDHGKDHTFLLSSPSSLGPIRKVHLHWSYIHLSLTDPTCFLGICNKKLYVNSVTVSLLSSYPKAFGDTALTCPRYSPAAIPTLRSMEFSVENSCSSTFHLLNFIWNAGPWIVYSR